MNKDINLKEFVQSLSSSQKNELYRLIETDYIKYELNEDYWRYGKYADKYKDDNLIKDIEHYAEDIYDYVEEEINNSINYGEVLKDAVEYVINEYKLLDT